MKIIHFILFSFFVSVFLCDGIFAQTQILDLNRALDLAVKNNSELLSAEQSLIIAQSRVKEAAFRFFPQVSFAGTITKSDLKYPIVFSEAFANHYLAPSPYENFYTFKTAVVQTIYSGGRIRNTLRLAKASIKQAETEYEKIKREVELNLKKAFFDLLYYKKLHTLSKNWYEKINALIQKARLGNFEKIQADKISKDLLFEVNLMEKEVRQKKLCLIKALNKEFDSDFDITGDFEPDVAELELEKAVFWAMEMRPELKSQVYKAEMDAISLNLAMSRKAPTISLGAVYDFVGNKFPLDKNSWYTTLAIQFPLSLDLWTQIKQRQSEIRQGDLKRAGFQDEVQLQIRSAYNDLMFWQREVSSMAKFYEDTNNKFLSISKTAAKNLNAIKATLDIYKIRLEYLKAVKNQLLSRAQMEWALGCKIPCQ